MVTNNSINQATAATGKVLQGAGVGTNNAFSTATYPSTSGTANNVLTSDGTNWISSTQPGGLITVTGTLTNAQIKALHGTPVQVIAAPAAGSVIYIVNSQIKMNYGGTNVFVAGASQTIDFYYGTSVVAASGLGNGNIVANQTKISWSTTTNQGGNNTNFDAIAINLYNPIATEITGNAANNNTITWRLVYCIVTI